MAWVLRSLVSEGSIGSVSATGYYFPDGDRVLGLNMPATRSLMCAAYGRNGVVMVIQTAGAVTNAQSVRLDIRIVLCDGASRTW